MESKTKIKSDPLLVKLEKAKIASLKEQDQYCELIEKAVKSGSDGDIADKVKSGGPDALYKVMEGCSFPPDYEDRKKFLKIHDGRILIHTELDKIPDKGIRTRIFFLNDLIEHTQRLRSMAVFSEHVGPLRGPGQQLFHFWSKRSSLQIMHKEAIALGKDAEAKKLVMLPGLMDIMVEQILEEWPKELDLGPWTALP